ncbi:MAG: hypothetical protein ACYCPP_08785 [Nitrososphaerales archaeon]
MNKEETVHFTITVPKSLKAQMYQFQEINWSGVATRAFRKQIEAQTIIRQFAEKGISDEEAINRGLSLRHAKQLESPNLRKSR